MAADLDFLSLGTAENLWDVDWSGWAYPPRREQMRLLENEAGSTGNVVIQEGSTPYRMARLSFTAESNAQFLAVRGFEEAGDPITFVDHDGSTCLVLVLDFSPSYVGMDLWRIDVTLVQLTEPEPPEEP